MLAIRTLTHDDLPLAMRLKQQAGWNQTEQDVLRFVALSAGGSFVAELNGHSVGMVVTFEFGNTPQSAVAWIAMMLVDEAHRGQGIGRALMSRALNNLDERGVATVRLDATPLGQPLYEKLGFAPQFSLSRYAGILNQTTIEPAQDQQVIAASQPLDAIADLDHRATGTDRRTLLERLIREYPQELRMVRRGDQITGYITSRPGANARQIGPCIAEPDAGELLLADALARYQGQAVFVDLPGDQAVAKELASSRGLSVQRKLTRMCRGRTVVEQLPLLWASSSPEKG
jgi:predicted N-acetyltransferase YhbS